MRRILLIIASIVAPVVDGAVVEGEQILFGLLEQRRHLRQRLAQSLERDAFIRRAVGMPR
ncbi:MAG TPA: hypothetical protein VFU34_01850 [Gaiellaceae bacterium]|nr:hypothetical protein [Gaiellaceae bacterium]